MKKTYLILSILMMSLCAFSQKKQPLTVPDMPIDNDSKIVSYQGVVELPGVSKKELYMRAVKWVKENYPNPTQVLQEQDSASGKLVGKAQFDVVRTLKNGTTAPSDRVQYTITFLFKEGRYKYEITKINIKAQSYLPIEKYFDENAENSQDHFNTLNQANDKFEAMVESLKERMNQPSEKVKKDDW